MIALDSGYKIQGDASAATVVDYTLHGLDANAIKQLAAGQLASSTGDLFTADSADVVASIILVNTDSSARTVNLYLTPSGGAARRIIPKDMSLGIGHSLHTDGKQISVLDTSGQLLSTWAVDDTPVDGETDKPISSNWAYDHAALYTAHVALYTAHIANFGLHNKLVRKAAAQTINNSTTLVNDDTLLLAVGANEVWLFQLFCIQDFSSAADFDCTFNVPTNATCLFGEPSTQPSVTTERQELFIAGSTKDSIIQLQGIAIVGDTAGNLQFQWAQNSAVVTDCRVEANSVLIATQLV